MCITLPDTKAILEMTFTRLDLFNNLVAAVVFGSRGIVVITMKQTLQPTPEPAPAREGKSTKSQSAIPEEREPKSKPIADMLVAFARKVIPVLASKKSSQTPHLILVEPN